MEFIRGIVSRLILQFIFFLSLFCFVFFISPYNYFTIKFFIIYNYAVIAMG